MVGASPGRAPLIRYSRRDLPMCRKPWSEREGFRGTKWLGGRIESRKRLGALKKSPATRYGNIWRSFEGTIRVSGTPPLCHRELLGGLRPRDDTIGRPLRGLERRRSDARREHSNPTRRTSIPQRNRSLPNDPTVHCFAQHQQLLQTEPQPLRAPRGCTDGSEKPPRKPAKNRRP